MPKGSKTRTKAARASRKNGAAGGRPALFQGKTAKPSWTLPPATVSKAGDHAARLGRALGTSVSVSDAVTAAIETFDADAYAMRIAARHARGLRRDPAGRTLTRPNLASYLREPQP